MRSVLLVVFVVGGGGVLLGWLLRRLHWRRASSVTAAATLVIRLGALVVFVSIAAGAFRRGGPWFLALGGVFVVLAVVLLVANLLFGVVVVFGSDVAAAWVVRTFARFGRRRRR